MKTLVPVMLFLLQIAKRYDILLIQEIRDVSETTDDEFVDAINEDVGFVSSLVATRTLTNFHFLRLFLACIIPFVLVFITTVLLRFVNQFSKVKTRSCPIFVKMCIVLS